MSKTERDPVYYLEKAPVPQAIVHMAVPMIMSMVLDLVYNIVNAFFIGKLGNTAMLAAITLAFPFQIVMMGVAQIFGVGGGTFISRLLGEKDFAAVRKVSSVSFYLSQLSGIAVMAVLLPFLRPLLGLMGAGGESLRYTSDFLVVLLPGSPLIIATIAMAEMIRAEGASTTSMTGMMLSVVLNVILDPVFIFVLRMNVAGAALATVVANGAAVAYFVRYMRGGSKYQSLSPRDFRPGMGIAQGIFKVGSAAFLFSGLMIVSTLFSGLSSIYTDMFQAFGAGVQANGMALARGLALIPLIFLGKLLFGLEGVIWSVPAAEISASLIGSLLWLDYRRKVPALPISLPAGTYITSAQA